MHPAGTYLGWERGLHGHLLERPLETATQGGHLDAPPAVRLHFIIIIIIISIVIINWGGGGRVVSAQKW